MQILISTCTLLYIHLLYCRALSGCQTAVECKSINSARTGYELLLEKYSEPDTHETLLQRYLEFLLMPTISDFNKAKQLITQALNDHVTGKHKLTTAAVQNVYGHAWNLALAKYKEKDYRSALEWFQYSLQLFASDDNVSRARALRYLARCHMDMLQYEDALTAARDAEKLEPKSLQTMFVLCTLFFKKGIKDKGMIAIVAF